MKTISGKIVSTKPVNLSKAANILSNFASSNNGASQSVSAYLRRASVAFNELVYFKKHHKLEKNPSKEEALTKSDISHRSVQEDEVRVQENGALNMNFGHDAVESNENGKRKVGSNLRKKEKKTKDGSLGSGKNDNTEVDIQQCNENVKEKSEEKKKKKKKDGSLGSGKNDNTEVDIEQSNENVKEKSEEKKKKKKKDGSLGSGKNDNTEVDIEQSNENVKEKSEEKKKKKKKDGSSVSGKNDNTKVHFEQGNENVKENNEEKKKKKKKRKNAEVDGVETSNSVAPESKKRRRTEADDE